ncbi:CPBP family intramembrane glutamic endopeptidase [Neolewinella persica]|uniref:CPBP family intramembrane glutamic endopeptidase n=1 Tax=Neolewinella persica TaxID=70998 RepID=UPI00037F6394|nr:CPBP family intramembrane glutamic endopeptidase [Neolewinella persica]
MRDPSFPNWKHLLALVAIYFGGTILGSIPAVAIAMAKGGIELDQGDLQAAISQTAPIAMGLPLVLCIIYGWRKLGKPKWTLGFENVGLMPGILAIIGTLLVANGVTMIAEYLPMYEGFVEMMKEAMVPSIGMAIAVVLGAPILEEALLRGVVLRGFLRKISPTKAILFSGLIFGAMHLHPVHVFFASIVGFALGYVYYRTRSLGLVILIHFINNGSSYYLGQQGLPDSSEEFLGIGMLGVFGVAALFTGLGVLSLWYMGHEYPLVPAPAEDEPVNEPVLAEV